LLASISAVTDRKDRPEQKMIYTHGWEVFKIITRSAAVVENADRAVGRKSYSNRSIKGDMVKKRK